MIIEIYNRVFDVDYDYQEKEAMTLEYPGCPEELTLNGIYVNGEDIMALLADKIVDKIHEVILEMINGGNDER